MTDVDLDDIDLVTTPLTTAQAAALAGVKPATIRQWIHRGHLVPTARDERGRPRFRGVDVARAEAATRDHAGRA